MSMETKIQAANREEWLTACLTALRLLFGRLLACLPDRIRVSCSWTYHVRERGARASLPADVVRARASPHAVTPEVAHTADGSHRAHRTTRRRLSESLPAEHSADGTAEVSISLEVADPPQVAALLLHELIHLSTGRDQHDQVFQRVAKAVGFIEPFADARPDEALARCLSSTCVKLGPYPHGKLGNLEPAGPKRDASLFRVACPTGHVWVWAPVGCLRLGLPTCFCGQPMRVEAKAPPQARPGPPTPSQQS